MTFHIEAVVRQLVVARARISDHANWVQHNPVAGTDQVCALTAFAPEGPGNWPSVSNAKETLRAAIGRPFIAPWNDAPERTHSDILIAFDKAIKLARDGRVA